MYVSDPVITLQSVLLCVVAYWASLRWVSVAPRMFFPTEYRIRREISKKDKEREQFNSPSTFAQCAKVERQIAALQVELTQATEAQPNSIKWLITITGYVIAYLVWVPWCVVHRGRTFAVIDPLWWCAPTFVSLCGVDDWDLGVFPILVMTWMT
eukprot:PhF_6_TR10129/c0_g1_i1/m.15739